MQSADLLYRIKENVNEYIEVVNAISKYEICQQIIDAKKLNPTWNFFPEKMR